MACAWTQSIDQLIVCGSRGIGMGGVVPEHGCAVGRIRAEAAPRHLVTLMFSDFQWVREEEVRSSSWCCRILGWSVIFWFGGAAAVLVALASIFVLPESIRFLVLNQRESRADQATRAPNGPESRRVADHDFSSGRMNLCACRTRALFSGPLRYVTPLLWLVFILNSLAFIFLQNCYR